MKRINLLLFFLLPILGFSQSNEQVNSSEESIFVQSDASDKDFSLFDKATIEAAEKEYDQVTEGTLININLTELEALHKSAPIEFSLEVPIDEENSLELKLKKINIFSNGFKVETSRGSRVDDSDLGVHYKGTLAGHTTSLVTLSVYKDELVGLISDDKYDYELVKLEDNSSRYILYKIVDLDQRIKDALFKFQCHTESDRQDLPTYTEDQLFGTDRSMMACQVIQVYLVGDYDFYLDNGSDVVAATNRLTAVFAQTITIYSAESINMQLSGVFIWDTPDGLGNNDAAVHRNNFRDYYNGAGAGWPGDLAQLISGRGSANTGAGGIAFFDGLCTDNSYALTIVGANAPIEDWTMYSRFVKVLTHEIGHNLNSRHTHACVWNGNSTQIDDYGNISSTTMMPVTNPEGNACLSQPYKLNVTPWIMSYYDSFGWDDLPGAVPFPMTNGMGAQSGNVMRDYVSNASCLGGSLIVNCSNITDQTLSCRADLPPVDFNLPIIVESCGDPILSALTIIPGNSGCPGDEVTITRTYFIQDQNGNMAECMQTFTIVSNQNPTIQCPAGGTVECAADISVSASNAIATAECGTPSVSLSGPVINGTPDCPGTTYTYTYTATDFCNRTASCTQVFTISNAGPTIACAGGGIVECAADISVGPGDVVTTTSCGLTPNINISGPVVNGTPDCPGTTYTYTYTVSDACNRTASCSRTFTIQNDGPTITCPADMIVECFDDIDVDPNDATVITSCTLGFNTVVSGPVTVGQADCPGTTHTYTYTTTDDCGRTAECEQVFTIQNDPPMVTCPGDITVACEDEIMLDPNDATVVTACNLGFTVYIKNPDAMGAPGCDGTVYTYTYVAVDDCGRQGTCTQTVTIENTPATISAPPGGTVECFEDIDISVNDATVENVCADFNLYLAPVTISGEIGCPGTTYTYTYRVVDVCGNIIEEDVVFTNGANAGPSIEAPADITCECFAGVNPNPNLATVTTACNNGVGSTVDVSGPQIIGAMDCPGTRYIYTYTVTDACGRTATDQQTFTINNGPPVFENCPDDNWLILNCEDYGGEAGTIAVIEAWIANVKATNSCGMPLTVFNNFNSNNIGTCINDGYTNVTFRATDNCGRTSFCTGTVVVIDTEAPKIIEEAQDHYEVCNYLTQENLDDWVDANGGAIAYDGCSNEQVFWSTIPNNPTINCMGQMGTTEVTVTFVVRDNCGNKTETTATFYALMGTNDLVQEEGEIELHEEIGEITLYQNVPNPFKDETLIRFNLVEDTEAILTIYDVTGKVLKVVEGDFAKGMNQVSINSSDLGASGIKYYSLRTENDIATKIMIQMD